MFTCTFAIVMLALPLLAAATAITPPINECNTGEIQCCNSIESVSSGQAL
jgi:hypothetical protein